MKCYSLAAVGCAVGEGGRGQVVKGLGHQTWDPGLHLTENGRFDMSQHMRPGSFQYFAGK